MKRVILLVLCTLLLSSQADAYTRARVYVHSKLDSDSIEGNVLQQTLLGNLMRKLVSHYTCLDMMDSTGLQQSLDFLRQQQLIGVDDAKVATELENISGLMDMKYLILVNVTATKALGFYKIGIIAKQKKKGGFPFYMDDAIFRSYDAAFNGIDKTVEALIKGFTTYLSDERESSGGEICAVKGPVTVTVETERKKEPPDEIVYAYCNGGDRPGKKSSYDRRSSKETWKLERYGIPDTKGTMEGSYLEETFVEEIDGCHVCAQSGNQGQWRYSKKTEASGSVSGLSDKTGADKFPTKDATVRLHFQEGGTFDISVAATSVKGKMLSSAEESAEGECDVMHKTWPKVSSTFTRPFEYTFTGFTGTPYDTALKGKKTLKFENKEIGEVTAVTIDFDLSRPTINK